MRPHVSAETLAKFRQGGLSPRRNARISAHLSRCSRCSRLNEDLGGVTALLASVHPPPMPDDLTGRIQAALASEAAKRVAVPAGSKPAAAAAGGGAAGPAGPAGNRGRRYRLAPGGSRRRGPGPFLPSTRPRFALGAMAAAALVVVAGVGVGMYEIVNAGSSHPSVSAAAPPGPRSASGRASAAAPVRGPALQYQRGGQNTTITPISSQTDFTASKLSTQVASQVSKYGSAGTRSGPMSVPGHSSAAAPGSQRFGSMVVSALQGCVDRIAAGEIVVLVEVARFQGSPATIIVTEVAQAAPQQIWVVGSGCSRSRSDVLHRSALSAAS
jgi:hypothetical protein